MSIKTNCPDLMIWGGILLMIVWIIAKSQVIATDQGWLTLAGWMGVVIAFVSLSIQIKRIEQKLDEIIENQEYASLQTIIRSR